MLTVFFSFYFVMMVSGFMKFLMNRKSFLISLLCLEFLAMSAYFNILVLLSMTSNYMVYGLFFISVLVCEGCMGLALLIISSYYYGSDKFSFINSLMC